MVFSYNSILVRKYKTNTKWKGEKTWRKRIQRVYCPCHYLYFNRSRNQSRLGIYIPDDKRAEYILEEINKNKQFVPLEATIEYCFNTLERYGNITYEEFSREWAIGKVVYSLTSEWRTVENASYGKVVYEKV